MTIELLQIYLRDATLLVGVLAILSFIKMMMHLTNMQRAKRIQDHLESIIERSDVPVGEKDSLRNIQTLTYKRNAGVILIMTLISIIFVDFPATRKVSTKYHSQEYYRDFLVYMMLRGPITLFLSIMLMPSVIFVMWIRHKKEMARYDFAAGIENRGMGLAT